jgi:small subunit ribosomal protein S21e
MKGTINQENKVTDTYLPRKCDFTDQIITSKDHSSIQISIADVLISLVRLNKTAPLILARPPILLSLVLSDPLDRVI